MELNELQDAGLTENEAKVYLAALELGEATVYRIAKKSAVKRTTTYLAVESLKEKGLISEYSRNNVMICYAENPRKIVEMLEKKKDGVEKILPEMLAIANIIQKKPKIRFFEGPEAYKEVFSDVLKYPDSEMLGTFNERFWDYEGYFTGHFMPERRKRRIWARILFKKCDQLKDIAQTGEKNFFKAKLVASDKYNVEIEMVIYGGNKVGMVSYEEKIAVIIESGKIYKTQKTFFEVI